jgi:hypothetical protein
MKSALTFSAFCGLAVFAAVSAAHAASMDDVMPELRQDAECMLRTLKSVPGIDGTEIGFSDTGRWSHPFIQYRAPPLSDGYRATIRFEATKSFYSSGDKKPFFIVALSGISSPGEDPPTYGTGAVGKLWEEKCDVHAMVLFP